MGKDAMRMATRKHSILALLLLVLAVTTCLSPARTSSDFTDTLTRLNPFGSCPLVKGKYDGPNKWSFDTPPCGYLGTTCWDLSPSLDSACTSPWPNTNISVPGLRGHRPSVPSTSPSTTTFTVTRATPWSLDAPSHVWIARPCAKPEQRVWPRRGISTTQRSRGATLGFSAPTLRGVHTGTRRRRA